MQPQCLHNLYSMASPSKPGSLDTYTSVLHFVVLSRDLTLYDALCCCLCSVNPLVLNCSYAVSRLLQLSLVPRLPRSGMRTLKLCRRGEPGIFLSREKRQRLRGGREDFIVRGRVDTQNRKKSEGSGQLSTHIYLSGVE